MGEEDVDIGAKLPGGSKDFFLGIDLCAGPEIALGSFQNAGWRVYSGKKLAQFWNPASFFDFEQQFRLPLQIMVRQAAVSGGPGKIQSFVFRSEFNRKIR